MASLVKRLIISSHIADICVLILLVNFVVASAGAETQDSSLDGKYTRVSNVVFEQIQISGPEFRYNRGTNEKSDPWSEGFPIRGQIEIDGDTVVLIHPILIEADQEFRVVDEGRHTYLVRVSDLVDGTEVNLKEIGLRKYKQRSMITSK